MYLVRSLTTWNNSNIPIAYITIGYKKYPSSLYRSLVASHYYTICSTLISCPYTRQSNNSKLSNYIHSSTRAVSSSPSKPKTIELNIGFPNTNFKLDSSDKLLENLDDIPIKITNAAFQKLTNTNKILQVQVESGGCSGFQYTFKLINDHDLTEEHRIATFKREGSARIAVDDPSLQFLEDCIIDFTDELIRSSFMVKQNKIATSKCGCGHSFDVNIAF